MDSEKYLVYPTELIIAAQERKGTDPIGYHEEEDVLLYKYDGIKEIDILEKPISVRQILLPEKYPGMILLLSNSGNIYRTRAEKKEEPFLIHKRTEHQRIISMVNFLETPSIVYLIAEESIKILQLETWEIINYFSVDRYFKIYPEAGYFDESFISNIFPSGNILLSNCDFQEMTPEYKIVRKYDTVLDNIHIFDFNYWISVSIDRPINSQEPMLIWHRYGQESDRKYTLTQLCDFEPPKINSGTYIFSNPVKIGPRKFMITVFNFLLIFGDDLQRIPLYIPLNIYKSINLLYNINNYQLFLRQWDDLYQIDWEQKKVIRHILRWNPEVHLIPRKPEDFLEIWKKTEILLPWIPRDLTFIMSEYI